MLEDRTPILVGTGQLVERDAEPREATEPLRMLEHCARAAAADAGADDRLLRSIDTCAIVPTIGWMTRNAPQMVAEQLGSRPVRTYTSADGGESGVAVTDHIAEQITRGEVKIAFIAGSNNFRALMKARATGTELNWTRGGTTDPECLGMNRDGSSDLERKYGLTMPTQVYPMFENALRAERGLDIETHRKSMGDLFTRFTRVAAQNPYAWFPTVRSSEELTTVTPQNRMISFPYPKYLNAVLTTDQAAGYFLTSVEAAKSLGISPERWVYWWGGAKATEKAWLMSTRPSFTECPAMRDSHTAALANAGVAVDDIDHFDFYSCFPVAVEMALKNLNLSEDDSRGFTVTGGLPYGGGPGSSYTLHAIASMADRLREKPGQKGMVTGNGWYLTKHAANVWSTEPRPGDSLPTAGLPESLPSARMDTAPRDVRDDREGQGTIEAYTVSYGRDGAPERGIVLGTTDAGDRFVANTPKDADILESLVTAEAIGRKGTVSVNDGAQLFAPS